MMKFAELICFL